ncbi:MAG: hypothetical protein AMXMBFR13_13170 [Phycisphaerae bacterium]
MLKPPLAVSPTCFLSSVCFLALRGSFALLLAIPVSGCGKEDLQQRSETDLVSRLVAAEPEKQPEISIALAAKGDSAIPRILEAFEQTADKPDTQVSLAGAVYRMKPSEARATALQKMHTEVKDPNAKEIIGRFASDPRR